MTTAETHLRKADYVVCNVSQSTVERLCAAHHYAGGCSNTGVFRHGLFHVAQSGTCLGVAQWVPPTRGAAEATWDGDFREVLSLSRLVLVPDLPTNAASYLIGQSVRLIKRDGRFRCLVTYADTWQGHTGNIYRASNWEYLGLVKSDASWVSADGVMRSRKAGPVTRSRAEMTTLGYEDVGTFAKHKFRMVLPEPQRKMPRGQMTLGEIA